MSRSRALRWSLALALLLPALLACGGGGDEGGPTPEPFAVMADCGSCQDCQEGVCVATGETPNACGECGPAPAETCGNGADDDCDGQIDEGCANPQTCGKGTLDTGETCDTAATGGDRAACPTECHDGNVCTADALRGAGTCQATCTHEAIFACGGADGCCPAGCTSQTDSDCFISFDRLSGARRPRTGEQSGLFGLFYPGLKTCNDGKPCTIDTLTGSEANCNVACSHQVVVACAFGDGCCPAGCDATVDDDRRPTCGNRVIEPPQEICEDNCLSSCEDGDACTIDLLLSAPETCNSACTFHLVSECASGDGCCPPGCSSWTDWNCIPCEGPDCTAPEGWTCSPQLLQQGRRLRLRLRHPRPRLPDPERLRLQLRRLRGLLGRQHLCSR